MKNIPILIFILIISFLVTYVLSIWWIKSARKMHFVGKDMNKYEKPYVAEGGGIPVIISIVLVIMLYIFIKVFYFKTTTHLIEIFAILTSILLACFLGFIDDFLGWKVGLKIWQKLFFTIPIAIPLMVINAGQSVWVIPFFGPINFGIIYPLLIIPLGVVFAANGFNMFAGYNGLEGGMGLIILSILSFISFIKGHIWLSFIGLIVCAVLIAFLIFNWYPAKLFPGDSFTHSIGSLIAIFAIFGNMEKIAIILFIPYFFDVILYIRAIAIDRVGAVEAFAKPQKDDSLELPYKKCYDMSHISIKLLKKFKKKVYEKDVVWSLIFFELILSIIVLFFVLT